VQWNPALSDLGAQDARTFELLDTAGDTSGKLRVIYGSGPADPAPFVLTLTPEYLARASGKWRDMPKRTPVI
jgi:hypothetical protein